MCDYQYKFSDVGSYFKKRHMAYQFISKLHFGARQDPIMTLSTNVETILQIKIKFVSSYFRTGSRKVNKITSEQIFCIKLYVYEQSKNDVVFYLHQSFLSLPLLTLAPTYKLFTSFTLQTEKIMLGLRKKLAIKAFITRFIYI